MKLLINNLKNIVRIILKVYKVNPLFSILSLLVIVSSSLLLSLQLNSIKILVDSIFHSNLNQVMIWSIILIGTYILLSLMDVIKPTLEIKVRESISVKYQREIALKAATMPMVMYDTPSFYDKLTRAKEDTNQKIVELFKTFFVMISVGFNVIAIVVTVSSIYPIVIIIIILCSLPGFIYSIAVGKKTHYVNRYQTPEWRLHHYLNRLICTKNLGREVRTLGIEEYLYSMWKNIGAKIRAETKNIEVRFAKLSIITDIINKFGLLLVFSLLLIMISSYKITLGALALTIQAVRSFNINFFAFLKSASDLYTNSLFIGDLFEFLEDSKEHNIAGKHLESHINKIEIIEFRNVYFKYPGSDEYVLKDINFTWNIGEKIALVGQNGAGKSTLVNLLLGLYKPSSGDIIVNNCNINDINIDSYLSKLTAVFQDFNKYYYTIEENIYMGNIVENSITQVNVDNLIKRTGLNESIMKYKDGLKTRLGTDFGGIDLSGGQWQKLAICRSLYRNTDMIILDEPTSSLDPLTEVSIFNEYSEMNSFKGVLLISHRLGSVRNADRILVLERGEIIEEGTHQDLILKNEGRYRELYSIQSKWYQKQNIVELEV